MRLNEGEMGDNTIGEDRDYRIRMMIQTLEELQTTVAHALSEAESELRRLGPEFNHLHTAARSYWIAHIQVALGGDYNEYMGGSMTSIQDTIDELEKELDTDYDEDY